MPKVINNPFKFWLDRGDFIFLYQLIKAAGLMDDYEQIRLAIKDGKVLVNGVQVFNQREEIHCNDRVILDRREIIVQKGRAQRTPEIEEPVEGHVRHGLVNKWKSQPLRKITELDNQIFILSTRLHEKLTETKQSLCLAESCTGGMVQQIITSHAGASVYFLGGIVSYADQIKINILKVKNSTLNKYGAVSEETVLEMVKGVKLLFGSDLAAAVTGIAGPEGGTPEKPVGTVHLAVFDGNRLEHRKELLNGNREEIRKRSVLKLLQMLLQE
ncbi:MAG: RNA-binding S4 domain-containing protein [Candidatus Cloacimonetes bacterium]|nr:RNA-binding S4 domain-containing protein [Candidatus Cloacimonadota bacterium]